MFGALNLQPGILKGATLLNLDDETEGEICIGSAGSADIFYNALFDQQLGSPAPNHHFVKLSVGSLKGGHSGVDIHLGRANAIQVMAHLMRDLATHPLPLSIVSFSGGNLINAIPRDAVAVVRIEHSSAADLEKVLDHVCATVTQEVVKQHAKAGEAPVLTATILTTALPPPETKIVPNDLVQQFCDLIEKCPSGPIEFCPDLPDVVSLSSNLSTLTLADGKLDISMLTRGSHEQKLNATVQKIADHFLPLHKSSTKKIDPMPCAWDPDPTSPLVALCKSTYKSLFSKDLAVMVVHGGLECGIIGRIYPTLQMVSFGPTVQFPHSPDERVFITSVPKFFQFLTALLEQL
jgi:dipeptidase D